MNSEIKHVIKPCRLEDCGIAGQRNLHFSFVNGTKSRAVPQIPWPKSHLSDEERLYLQMRHDGHRWWGPITNLNQIRVRFIGTILEHLITYSSRFSYFTDPILHALFHEDQKSRFSGPQVEDLAIDSEVSGIDLPFIGHRNVARKHKEMKMPFKLIPNCSQFRLNSTKYDWLAMLFGYPMKAKSSEVQIRNWKNGKANKYLFSMFLNLKKLRDEGRKNFWKNLKNDKSVQEYFKLSWRVMASRPYLVSSLNHVFPNWHEDMSLEMIYDILDKVKNLVETKATKIEYKRVYIPKKVDSQGKPLLNEDGKWTGVRPLGVPSPEWHLSSYVK